MNRHLFPTALLADTSSLRAPRMTRYACDIWWEEVGEAPHRTSLVVLQFFLQESRQLAVKI